MATTKEKAQQQDAGTFAEKTEDFLRENDKMVSYIGIAVFVLLAAAAYMKFKFIPDREVAAQEAMFRAEYYFAADSFELALNGSFDGDMGFADISEKFSFTKSADLAGYYAGICNLQLGNYQAAIDRLKGFGGDDERLQILKLSAIGDAYMQLGDTEKGMSHYKKAANQSRDAFTKPLMLHKYGKALESQGDNAAALEMYEQIRANYPESQEGRGINADIQRVSASI